MSKIKKIGIIGAGDIGFNLAEILAIQGYDVTIYNRYHQVNGNPSPYWLNKLGTVMDMNDSLQLPGCTEVLLTHNIEDLNNSDIIVITAGAKRSSPEESREELASKNALIFKSFVEFIAKNNDTLFLIISNPVDFLTQYIIEEVAKYNKLDKEIVAKKIAGVSYIDSMRLQNIVKGFIRKLHPTIEDIKVDGLAIGEHGPSMVPIINSLNINGKPASHFLSSVELKQITEQTILRGNDIIKLTGASSVLGPSHAVIFMINKIIKEVSAYIPCSVWDGQRCIGKIAVFNGPHIVNHLLPPMSDDEKEKFASSCIALDKQFNNIKALL